jgi:hypothetical protein
MQEIKNDQEIINEKDKGSFPKKNQLYGEVCCHNTKDFMNKADNMLDSEF